MKVTLWQQFSSNHSSHFKIVGVFDAPGDAEKAVAEIKSILGTISQWHKDNPDEAEALYQRWGSGEEWPPALSKAEQELAKQYNVKWPAGIDWFDDVRIHVSLGHLVLIDTKFQTDWGPQPFDAIINRLGGYGLVVGTSIGGDYFGGIMVLLQCEAPDGKVAQEIATEKETEWETETIRVYGHRLTFEWDYDEGMWELEELIEYLKQQRCSKIAYWFYATHYTATEHYVADD